MFQKTQLYTSDKISQICLEANKTYLLLVAEGCDINDIPILNVLAEVYSVVVPAVICGSDLYADAIIVCELKDKSKIVYCTKEKDVSKNILIQSNSVLIFMDWLDPNIYQYLDKLFSLTDDKFSILGAGCGRTTMKNDAIITKNGVALTNGFLILFSETKMVVKAGHGSSFWNGYYMARMKDSNTIATINGENAASFYIGLIKKHFNEEINSDNIFTMGLKYPLGLLGATYGEQPLRVPVAIVGEHLVVAGPIEDESMLSLMNSNHVCVLEASEKCLETIKKESENLEDKECFLVECVGRRVLLGNLFEDELKTISKHLSSTKKVYGVLSLGEIANGSTRYIEYFNETCAMGLF
ncbi:MAG: FIST C-terminal domain-containing protein [Campylobacteraceae bacterium]|nr:FIST C-terminal domain-containing protein [Campylobacteraceae bacterium]